VRNANTYSGTDADARNAATVEAMWRILQAEEPADYIRCVPQA
jgi:GDP-D-mannose dehydratase